jgi:hypothetical protein
VRRPPNRKALLAATVLFVAAIAAVLAQPAAPALAGPDPAPGLAPAQAGAGGL